MEKHIFVFEGEAGFFSKRQFVFMVQRKVFDIEKDTLF